MSDTPKTRALQRTNMSGEMLVPAQLSMTLERELNQWKKMAEDLYNELDIAVEFGKPSAEAEEEIKRFKQLRDGRTF